MLGGQNTVESRDAESPFVVQKVADVSLAKAGFARQSEAGEFTVGDTVPKKQPQVVLQCLEFHTQILYS